MKLCRSRLPIHVRSSFVPRTLRLLVQQRGDAFQNRSFLTGRGGGRSRGFSTAAEAPVDLESCERRLAELLRRFDNAKSRAELKKAYFTRAKTCHPDTAEGTAGAGGSNKMENEGTSSSFVTLQSDYSEALKLMDVVQRLRNLRPQPASGSVNNDSAQPGTEGSFSDLLDEEERKQRQREACEAAIAAEDAEARAEMRKVLASSFGCFLVLYWMWRGLDDTRKDASESWYFESGHHQRVAATKLAAQQAGTGGNTSNSTTTLCEFLVYYLFGSDYYGKSSDPRQQLLEAQGGACGKGDAGSMSATFIRRQYQRWRLEMQRQKLRDELSSCSCQDDSEYESADVVAKAKHDEEVPGSCAASSSRTSWSAASRRETLTSTLTSEVVSLRGGEFIQLLNNIGVTIDWAKVRTNKRAREQQEEEEKRAKLREGGESANRNYNYPSVVDTEDKPLATLRDNNLYADNLLLDDLVQRARATREERELRMERSGPGNAG